MSCLEFKLRIINNGYFVARLVLKIINHYHITNTVVHGKVKDINDEQVYTYYNSYSLFEFLQE